MTYVVHHFKTGTKQMHPNDDDGISPRGLLDLKIEQDMVRDFHYRFGILVNEVPTIPSEGVRYLRVGLIDEEVNKELIPALRRRRLVDIADALGDSLYVLLGTAVSYGISMEPIFREIHLSNMSKGDPFPIIRPDGKILKAANWRPPDILTILRNQR